MRCGSGREYTRRRETGAIGDVHTHAVNRVKRLMPDVMRRFSAGRQRSRHAPILGTHFA